MTDWTPPVIVTRRDGDAHLDAPDAQSVDALQRLNLPRPAKPPENAWILALRVRDSAMPAVLELIRPDGVKLCIDFSAGKALHRASEAGKGIQPLARALGLQAFRKRHGVMPRIVDATGGLGQDAWALATLGVQITIIERHPIVHALLANALSRAAAESATQGTALNVRLLHAQAETALPDLEADAIYLDPMYPERRRKKAGSRKGMQFLHALLGPPPDNANDTLLPAALSSGASRVVVKRPRGAPLLAGSEHWKGQRTHMESPNTRHDIYHIHGS